MSRPRSPNSTGCTPRSRADRGGRRAGGDEQTGGYVDARDAAIAELDRLLPARPLELVDREWLQTEYVDTQRSRADLARQFGCGSTTIRDDLALAGIAMRGPLTDSMPPELGDRDWLAAAYADRSAEAIARELGVGATAVRRPMHKLGVEVDTHRSR